MVTAAQKLNRIAIVRKHKKEIDVSVCLPTQACPPLLMTILFSSRFAGPDR